MTLEEQVLALIESNIQNLEWLKEQIEYNEDYQSRYMLKTIKATLEDVRRELS